MSPRKKRLTYPIFLGSKLRRLRDNLLRLSQADMSKKLEDLPSSPSPGRISEYESGKRLPALRILLEYSKLTRIPLNTIVDDDEDLPDRLPPNPSEKQD